MKNLVQVKNIFSTQLPKMPKEYIVRLIFDKRHETLLIKTNQEILGAISYRLFESQKFVEIAFLAIKQNY